MRARLTIGILATFCTVAGAQANYLHQTINTNSLDYAEYDALTNSAGPYPFNNFGVGASASIALDVSASVAGATSFDFPTITAGETFAAGSSLNYAYTANWTGGSIGSHAGLSASAGFSYDIGPFSGNYPIYDQALNTHADGTIAGGTTLTGGTANDSASGESHNFGLTESAVFASASAGVNVGLKLDSSVSYTPTVQYGYYSWINTTGTLSASDVVTWHGVSSGPLTYDFASNLELQAGSANFYLNILPAVQMQMAITPEATMTLPLTGYVTAEAFGQTLADATIGLGNLYSMQDNGDTWNDDVNFNGSGYYSFELHEDNSQCQFRDTPTCEVYQVLGGDPLLTAQTLFPGNTSQTTNVGDNGGFNPGVVNRPNLPGACDPRTGICYDSTDPNMPVGPGTVVITSGVPEPASWLSLVTGFLLTGWLMRYSAVNRRMRSA